MVVAAFFAVSLSGAIFCLEFIDVDVDLELACCILGWSLVNFWQDGFLRLPENYRHRSGFEGYRLEWMPPDMLESKLGNFAGEFARPIWL